MARIPELDLAHLLASLAADTVNTREADLVVATGGRIAERHKAEIGGEALLRRDLTAASASGGGYLVETGNLPAAAALRPASVAVQSGAVVLPGLSGNVAIPKVTTAATTYWLTNEGTAITESTPAFGTLTLSPKTAGAYFEFSRQLALQGVAFSQFVQSELVAAAAQAVDVAILNGAGSGGAPTGLLGTSGIGTASGGTLAYAAILTALQTVLAAGATEAGLGWVTTPAVATLLRSRVRVTGADLAILGDDNRIAGYPCRVSSNVPAGVLALVDWGRIVVGSWGPGIAVETNPFAGFTAGILGARVMVSVDVGVLAPTTIYSLTGCT